MPQKINPKLAKGIIANSQKLYSLSTTGLYSAVRMFEGDSSSYMLFDGLMEEGLELLSGGERSLAAIAFLVAIFKARPSPFYVMDEVEAALDDMNLTRLLAIFKELQETSQLIVITHQKRTMEIADALYGVTMRDGVTTVVSQRLAD